MKVFLLRHATRPFTLGDVPLNEDGIEQAKELAQEPLWRGTEQILCSPKRRAQMTVEPIAQKYSIPVLCLDALDQMHSHEDENEFATRVKNMILRIEQGEFGQKILVCSHSDWLSIAVRVIPTDATNLSFHMFQCAEYLSFEVDDGLWKIQD